MIENMEKEVKKPKTVLFSNLLYQFAVIVFFTVFFVVFVFEYFIFMFISIVIAVITTLFLKSFKEVPIPKLFTQQLGNQLKSIIDLIKTEITIQNFKNILQKTVIFNLRTAKIIPEFDRETLEDVEEYILKKIAPESEE